MLYETGNKYQKVDVQMLTIGNFWKVGHYKYYIFLYTWSFYFLKQKAVISKFKSNKEKVILIRPKTYCNFKLSKSLAMREKYSMNLANLETDSSGIK